MNKNSLRFIKISIIGLVFFGLDRIVKWYFFGNPGKKIYILKDFILEYYSNKGIAFSIGLPVWLIYIMTIGIILFLLWLTFSKFKKNMQDESTAISLIILGALSNLLDRIHYSQVVDYVSIYYYPIFNIADCLIVIGVGWWFLIKLKEKN